MYTIAIIDQTTKKIVDTYTDVIPSDLSPTNSLVLPAILLWLRRWIK